MKAAAQGLLLFVLGLLAPLVVPVCLLACRVPWWLQTPDDPHSPYGKYEPRVRAVYERYGAFVGDLYWLGFRNSFYGLAYSLKPDWLKGLAIPYDQLPMRLVERRFYRMITVEGADWELTLKLGFVVVIIGRRLSPLWNNEPGAIPRPINMDGRPIFSIRSSG